MIKDCIRGELWSISVLGFPPKPYTQNANKSVNNMVTRNLKKLSKISDIVRELKKSVEKQVVQIELPLINQGKWKVAPEYREY